MPKLERYNTPGFVEDFPDDPSKQAEMNAKWSANVARWVEASQVGDVYDRGNYGPRPAFYNPLLTDVPDDAQIAPIKWNAFPGRFSALFPDDSGSWFKWSDYGNLPDVRTDLCSGSSVAPAPYSPTGPRGWQDEYCEWSVARDAGGKITAIMFTCENPEYWLTLWQCDPAAVLRLYHSLVGPKVTLLDLALKDGVGRPLTDPATGRWAYDPLNKWNVGPHLLADGGGAVHLTSSPNTLGAEFDLAAAASMPRIDSSGQPVTASAPLICCALYGRIGRHSDPTIGQNVNAFVNRSGLSGARVTLTDPPGLYIQTPAFSAFRTPDGSDPASYWKVVRGRTKAGSEPIDRILHATYAVPVGKGFSVGDITIGGEPIRYGGQVTSAITMALLGTAFATGGPNQSPVSCTTTLSALESAPCAQALQGADVFRAYRAAEAAFNELPMSLPVLALPIAQGATVRNVAMPLNLNKVPTSLAAVTTSQKVIMSVQGFETIAGLVTAIVSIDVAPDAELGDCGVSLTVPGLPSSPYPAIGLLTVVAKSAAMTSPTSSDTPQSRRLRGRA